MRINFKRFFRRLIKKLRRKKHKMLCRMGKGGVISRHSTISEKHLISIAPTADIGPYSVLRATRSKIKIGAYSQLGPRVTIFAGNDVFIGKYVMIAPNCMIAAGNHRIDELTKPMRFAGSTTNGPIIIDDDVWIGANCTITDAIHIGTGAVVGANSIVTKDIPPYAIVGGVPARVIGNRKGKLP